MIPLRRLNSSKDERDSKENFKMGWLAIKKSPLSYQASDPQASYFQASDRLGSLDHYFFGETFRFQAF